MLGALLTDWCLRGANDRHPPGSLQIAVVRIEVKLTFSLWVEPSDTIGVVKERIMDRMGFPSHEQHLIFQGVTGTRRRADPRLTLAPTMR
jgi:hypothetical protein